MSLTPFLIGDQWIVGAGAPLTSVFPADGSVFAELSTATEDDVDRAVATAAKAQRDPKWRNMPPQERAGLLLKIADLTAARAEDLARRQMHENGKPISECRAQAASIASTFRYFASACEAATTDTPAARGNYWNTVIYQPYGVVAAITPWNSPLTMEVQKLAPALAAGNAVILKPSEVTPTIGLEFGRICLEAGLPPGIVNVLTGTGQVVGQALAKHDGVRMISFTGGTANGRYLAKVAAERLIPIALELGGKSPHIVFSDAQIEKAVDAVIGGIFEGAGQSCVAGSRLFVEKPILDRFLDRLVAKTRGLRIAHPERAESQVGPIASFAHRERVEEFVQSARNDGGDILTGGRRPASSELAKGAFYEPTIVAGLTMRAKVCREEIFGPVLCVLPFDGEEDVIAQANDTAYGLACGIWTDNYQRAWRVATAIDAGTVWINTYKTLSMAMPFGGFKDSGLGREKGIGGMRLYQQSKGMFWGL